MRAMLCLQVLVAVLVALRVLPFPSLQELRPAHGTLVAAMFVLLSAAVITLTWRQHTEGRTYFALLHAAFHDVETGLPNRAAAERTIDSWLKKGVPCSCLCLELRGTGISAQQTRALLRSCVLRLLPFAKGDATLARLTQDRFVLLLCGSQSRSHLGSLAEEILHAVVPPHLLEGKLAAISVNVGVASAPADAVETSALLAAAKRALAMARTEESGQVRFADEAGGAQRARTSMLSSKLQRVLIDGLLQLVYQPIYNSSGDMVAAEALTRWHDREEGPVAPSEFIPVAESTGLIVPLSNWVMRTACEQMARWKAVGSPIRRIAVNVSIKQVSRKDFYGTVQRTLADTGLDASCLELEVTEGALATDFEAVNRNLQALRKLGVRIAIDDFGTGYSSLGRVRELHADALKIDRLFIQGATESKGGAAMVQAIIDMAHTLKLSVVAEGIETGEQMEILRQLRCDEMQGFLLSKPKSAEAITRDLQLASPSAQKQQPVRMVPRPVAASSLSG